MPPDQAANALLPAELGRWMAARGDRVTFVAHEPRTATQRDLGQSAPGDHAIRWIRRRRRTAADRWLKVDAWKLSKKVHAALDDVAATSDLLHLHSNGLIIEVAARWARRRNIPYVLTLYGTEIWHYRRHWPVDRFTAAYRHAASVTFYSRRLLERAKSLGLDRDGLSVIYPAVAESFGASDSTPREQRRQRLGVSERLLIVNVKRLHPLAGQRFLLEAFATVRNASLDARLVICGDGPLRAELAALAQRLGIHDRVTFTGVIPNETVAEYVAAADVFALPSLLEALPTVAAEALACGTPVISSDNPGGVELHELFADDVRIVPRENVTQLSATLQDFLRAPRRTNAATLQTIARLFSPASVLAAYDDVYRRAARRLA